MNSFNTVDNSYIPLYLSAFYLYSLLSRSSLNCIYLLLYVTIIRTGCQLKTRFASPSDHDTPPPPIDSLLTHKLTSRIAMGERHRLNVAEADCSFCRKPPVASEAIDGCDSSLSSVDMLLDLDLFLFCILHVSLFVSAKIKDFGISVV